MKGPGADGQLGRVVEDPDTGNLMVRLDRAAQDLRVPILSPHDWQLANEERLTNMAMARVAYGTDRELQHATGQKFNVPEWVSLRDAQRHVWLNGPPADASELRKRVWNAVMEELRR